jgi:hypothetical protein
MRRPGRSVFGRHDFFWVYGPVSSLWGLTKGCLCEPREMYGLRPYANQAWKACGMFIGVSLAGCTSIRIIVTLGYEYRLFVADIT